jgi:hypothetical protein
MEFGKPREDAAEQGFGKILHQPDARRPVQGPAGQRGQGPVVGSENLTRELEEDLARRRQHETPALPAEQRYLQYVLQTLHLQAQRRLRDEHALCGPQHRTGCDDPG